LTRRALPSVPLRHISGRDKNWQSLDRTLVNTDQDVAIRAKSDGSDVFAALKRKGIRLVTMERMHKLIVGASIR